MNFYDVIEDWDKVKKRWEAWWNCDIYDRPLIKVAAPKKNPVIPPELADFMKREADPKQRYTDPDYMINKALYEFHTTYYGGESVPMLNHSWSVGHALTLGCEPHYGSTFWAEPLIAKEGKKYPEISFGENNPWWQLIQSNTRKSPRQASKDIMLCPCGATKRAIPSRWP